MAESHGSGRPTGRTRAPTRRRRTCTLLLVLVLVGSPLTVGVAVGQEPTFETTVPEPVVVPGETQELTFQLRNGAGDPDESVDTAGDVRVTVDDGDSSIEVLSGTRSLGDVADGESRNVAVRIDVPEDVEPGTYELPVEISYAHDGETQTDTGTLTVRVEDRAYFRVDDVESSVAVGDTGNVSVTMTNVGNQAASAASVSLSSTSADVAFGDASSASRYVGEWAPGETKTVTYRTTVGENADPVNYTLQSRVTYDDDGGTTEQSRQFRVGVKPTAEQSFAVSNVESTLRVGEDGDLAGTVTNTGPRAAENVVVTFEPQSPNIEASETEVAVGDLGPGESATFSFDAEVSDSAAGGSRQFTFDVRYRNDNGDQRTAASQDVQAMVEPERSRFTVSVVDANFSAGDDGELALELTNVGDEPLSDLSAKLYADSPLSSSDDEAFFESLGPGESVTLRFGMSVGNDAIEKNYPAKLDFRYDTSDGETHISDTYQVPVRVDDDGEGGIELSLPIIGIGLIAILLFFVIAGYFRE